jgi:hypothetical protein
MAIFQQDGARLIFIGRFAKFWIVCCLSDGSEAMGSGGHPGPRTSHPAISSCGAILYMCHNCPGICRSCRTELWLLWEEQQRIRCSELGKKLTIGWMFTVWHEVHILNDYNKQVRNLGSSSMFWNILNRFHLIINIITVIYNRSVLFGRPCITGKAYKYVTRPHKIIHGGISMRRFKLLIILG